MMSEDLRKILVRGHKKGVPEIYLYAAMATNGVIGDQGKLPWSSPEDMEWLRRELQVGVTQPSGGSDKVFVCGRRTWEGLPASWSAKAPGPLRLAVVITSHPERVQPKGEGRAVRAARSLTEALQVSAEDPYKRDIAILGGGKVFEEAAMRGMPDIMWITTFNQDFPGDTVCQLDLRGYTHDRVMVYPPTSKIGYTRIRYKRQESFLNAYSEEKVVEVNVSDDLCVDCRSRAPRLSGDRDIYRLSMKWSIPQGRLSPVITPFPTAPLD